MGKFKGILKVTAALAPVIVAMGVMTGGIVFQFKGISGRNKVIEDFKQTEKYTVSFNEEEENIKNQYLEGKIDKDELNDKIDYINSRDYVKGLIKSEPDYEDGKYLKPLLQSEKEREGGFATAMASALVYWSVINPLSCEGRILNRLEEEGFDEIANG